MQLRSGIGSDAASVLKAVTAWLIRLSLRHQEPAHGAGARRLCGAACLLSAPRLAAPGGALGGCGHEVGRHPLWLGRSAPRL